MTTFFLTALLMAVKLVNKSAVIAVSAASITLSDAPRAQDNLSKLLTTLSANAAPSAGTLQNLCTFLVRVPALGAAIAESAIKKKIKKFLPIDSPHGEL